MATTKIFLQQKFPDIRYVERMCVRTYDASRNALAQVQNLLYTLNRVSNIIFIACKYILQKDHGFCLAAHESTYQDWLDLNRDNK